MKNLNTIITYIFLIIINALLVALIKWICGFEATVIGFIIYVLVKIDLIQIKKNK
ncbi:hypothetical protein Harreka1_40 [Olleya phage Harreka_1]|uniref:Uncharacterized protein n=1 Tax=Olleya phage Harreka_1 TaxID=2745673 RepID=A0A8E5EBI5_9CAUD|nr:hypothetical protein M1M26_gp40 [Olleya phage Harreka_1]QQV90447.1 hypothetical protein Harreka1_40 [Olleya phage Harreka_1]